MLPAFVSSFTCMFDFVLVSFFPYIFFRVSFACLLFDLSTRKHRFICYLSTQTDWFLSLSLLVAHNQSAQYAHCTPQTKAKQLSAIK